MPKIDPNDLLKALGVLLSPKGGIKSSDEVIRLVKLMQRFNKKMVSKCIYIQILQASTSELLENFLDEKGWGLLNAWYFDAVLAKNWPLCIELMKLLVVCPMSVSRLKDDVGDNQALKLTRQLSCDTKVDEQVKLLATQVLNKWMAIISPSKEPEAFTPLNGCARIKSADQKNSLQNDQIDSINGGKGRAKGKSAPGKDSESDVNAMGEELKPLDLLQGLTEDLSESLKKEEKEIKCRNEKDIGKEHKRAKNKENGRETRKIETLTLKQKMDDGLESDRREKGKERQKDKDRREKKSKPYSQAELRDKLGDTERKRIKTLAQKMKDDLESKKDSNTKERPNASSSMTAGLLKTPKNFRMENKDKDGVSNFTDLMGALDSDKAKKSVKVAPSKNKNRGLMESLSSTNFSKQPASKHKNVKSNSKKPVLLSSNQDSRAPSPKIDIKRVEHQDLKDEKTKPVQINLPEKKSENCPADLHSPIMKNKTVLKESNLFGNVLSTIMHDELALNDDPPRKKKRRLSEVKEDKEAAETAKIESEKEKKEGVQKEVVPTFSFYGGGEEECKNNAMETGNDGTSSLGNDKGGICMQTSDSEVDFNKSAILMPKEVSGILVMVKGSSSIKKNIHWEKDENLVQIEYFEMDETERVNVNKVKFDTMRQREAAMEKARLTALGNKAPRDEEEYIANAVNDTIPWKLVALDSEAPIDDYGNGSNEKVVQAQREKTVLQALVFNYKKPPEPSEPDFCLIPKEDPRLVPLEDNSEEAQDSLIDYSITGWPGNIPTAGPFATSANFNHVFSTVQPGLIQGLMGEKTLPTASLENALYAAQRAASEALRQERLLPPGTPIELETTGPPGPSNTSMMPPLGIKDPNIQLPKENNMGPTNFYGNKMENINGFIPEPYFNGVPPNNGFPPQMERGGNGFHPEVEHFGNNGFHPQMDQSSNNWRMNVVPTRGFGRGGRGFRPSDHSNRGFGSMGVSGGQGLGNTRKRHRDRKDGGRGKKPDDRRQKWPSKPCKFWMDTGHCKNEDKCRFQHPSR